MDNIDDQELKELLEKKAIEILKESKKTKNEEEGPVVEINDSNFDELIRTHRAIVVDFWAP